jgi:hypothetical protein
VLRRSIYSGDEIKKNEIGKACSTYRDRKNAHRVLVGKSDGRRPLGIPRRRWKKNIKIGYLRSEMGA